MKKLIDIINEVEAFKQPRDKLAKSSLGKNETSNPKTDGNFAVKTKKDKTRRADTQPGADVDNYERLNLNVREETTLDLIDLINEISNNRLDAYRNAVERKGLNKAGGKRVNGDNLAADKRYPGHAFSNPVKVKGTRNEEVEMSEGLSPLGAKHLLNRHRAEGDYFDLDSATIADLHVEATNMGYRGSDNGHSLSHNFHSHLMRKAQKMNEEMELEEQYSATVWSNGGKHEWIISKGDDVHKRSGLIHSSRAKAISDLKKNIPKDANEEVEQVNEISTKTVKSYGNKVMKQLTSMKKDQLKGKRLTPDDKSTLRKRVSGLQAAQRHSHKKGYANQPWHEEVEQVDEISSQRKADYLSAAKKDMQVKKAGYQHTRNGDPEYAKKLMAKALQRKKIMNKVSEDVELDEISTTTLRSYKGKAEKSMYDMAAKVGGHYRDTHGKTVSAEKKKDILNTSKKSARRASFIRKAQNVINSGERD